MLLDDQQVMLNDLVSAYQEAILYYEDAVKQLQSDDLVRVFQEICSLHETAVSHLSAAIRETGDLPRAPHDERGELHKMFTHMKATLADDERQVFLTDRTTHERQIDELVQRARQMDFPPATKQLMEMLNSQQDTVLQQLAAAEHLV